MAVPSAEIRWIVAVLSWVVAQTAAPPVAAYGLTRPDSQYIIDTWQTDEGLPENSATAMAQTPDGYLWFGTFGGLVRFDGVEFKVLDPSNTPELPGAGVVNLHLDRSGRLWVSTYQGMAMREADRWRRFDEKDGWTGDIVRHFIEHANGEVVAICFNGQVLAFRDGRFITLSPPPQMTPQTYVGHVDEAGHWWVAMDRFVGRWDGERWVETFESSRQDTFGCGRARDGGMWLLIGRTLRKYLQGQLQSKVELDELPGGIWSLYEDRSGHVWVCTFDRGVCRVSPTGRLTRWDARSGLSFDGVRFAFEDREANIWIGTSGGGLMRFKLRRFHMPGRAEGLDRRVTTSVWADERANVWIGTYGGGLYRLSENGIESVTLPGWTGSEVYVQSVLGDRLGGVWVGTFGQGFARLDGDAIRWFPAAETGGANGLAAFEDSRGRIWLSGGDGVAMFDNDRLLQFPAAADGSKLNGVHAFAEDVVGGIWATNGWLFRLNQDRFEPVIDPHGEPIRDIACLATDRDGTVWCGGMERLLRWQNTHEATVVDLRAAGLRTNVVDGMIEDDQGYWWLTTRRGVIRVERRALLSLGAGSAPYQLLDKHDGLTTTNMTDGRHPALWRDTQGRLWFATQRGPAMIDPKQFRRNDQAPPVCVTSVRYHVRGREGKADVQERLEPPPTGAVRLPPGSQRVEIHYAALSFVAPHKVEYQIMLEGLDSQWQDAAGRRVAYYHDLPPGGYTFRVKGANNDGVWNEAGAALNVTIGAFFWQTVWFRLAAVLVLIASGALIAWWAAASRSRHRRHIEERARLIVEASPQAIIIVDRDGVIRMVNSRTETLFGYPRRELVGDSVETLIPEQDHPFHREFREAGSANSAAHPMVVGRDLHARRKDGSEFPVEVGLNPIESADGLFNLVSLVDITARRHAELESARQRNELAHLSRVTLLGELSGSLAHELNQPLAAILSNAQAARRFLDRDRADLAEVRDILDDIVAEDKRASEVIRRLRLLLTKGEVQRTPLRINDLVRDVLMLMRSDLINHGVTVAADLAGGLPRISGDRVQLQQVVLNLLMNACDAVSAMPAARRRLTVRTRRGDDSLIQLSIIDQGPGIPPDKLERVFDAFYTTKSHGMGIGLAVCKTIVAAHGGRLWADNNDTGGATFQFTLPAQDGDSS